MNSLPENDSSSAPEDAPHSSSGSEETSPAYVLNNEPADLLAPDVAPAVAEPDRPLFQSFSAPEFHPPSRNPHLGDVAILAVFAFFGLLCASALIFSALHFHMFGVSTQQEATTEVHYALGSELVLYVFTFAASLLFFPLIWHRSLFGGMQWNGAIAFQLRRKLFFIAVLCWALALANLALLPGPKDAPIEKIFDTPGAAWLMFAFGVSIAPFFEEMVFRGFLLPAICTACDWTDESISSRFNLPLSSTFRSVCSILAMTTVSAVTIGTPIALVYAIITRSPVLFLVILPIAPAVYLGLVTARQPQAELLIRPLTQNGNPQWSLQAMVIASIATSIPFAAMHAPQIGYSWGPLALLVGVSLVLCWARLSTRSLAASVFVHATYNFLLFSLMMLGTGGFRHLDKM